jgi:hypothetical protein
MDKKWDRMTTDEKLDALREDVARAFNAINDVNRELTALAHRVTGAASLASEVAKKVETLAER